MGNLTQNISRHELACKCGCGFDTMDWETITVVQDICDYFAIEQGLDKVVLHINSAARCLNYNRKPTAQGGPGSTDNSQHPKGRAMDIWIEGIEPEEIYTYLDTSYPNRLGVGLYNTFVHIDSRKHKARW